MKQITTFRPGSLIRFFSTLNSQTHFGILGDIDYENMIVTVFWSNVGKSHILADNLENTLKKEGYKFGIDTFFEIVVF